MFAVGLRRAWAAATGRRTLVLTSRTYRADLLSGWRPFRRGLERFSLELPIVLEQDLHLALCLLQLFAAGVGELHALLKKGERFFQRYITLFQFLDYLFQPQEAFLELGQRDLLLYPF